MFRVVPKFGNFCSSLWAGDSSSTFAALLLACKVFILGWMEKNLQPRPRRSPPVLEEWANCVLENFLCSSSRQQPPNILHAYICLTLVMLARRFYFQEKMGGSSRFWMNGGLFTCFSVVALGHIGGSRTQKHEATMTFARLDSVPFCSGSVCPGWHETLLGRCLHWSCIRHLSIRRGSL